MTKGKATALTGLEIAVIGMAGRFPGAKNVEQFWDNLKDGVDAVTFYSDEELLADGIDQGSIDHPNYIKAGRQVEGKEFFDSSFFGYLPGEARVMDPQARILHQCVWNALENAGVVPENYDGLIGLYAGTGSGFNWEAYNKIVPADDSVDPLTASQLSNRDFTCARITYKLNLKGPALFVQTACSTSLVAIHLASRALLTGECTIALAGGVTIQNAGKTGYLYQEGMISSPDGLCRAFDAQSRGTVGGEGVGVVVLKRLKNALADRDYIWAVVKGSAINNDGLRKVGFTAPSVDGQADVIRLAHKMARVEARSISYVETHGTGTVLGDPIEIEALTQAFGKSSEKYCAIGAVKTNIGHVDAAAGVAGFIKTVLSLRHRALPPSLNFTTPNPAIDFDSGPFYVNTQLKEWINPQYPLRAGVSSFGIGGTNAHIILEEAPPVSPSAEGREYQLLLFSAKSAAALDRQTALLKEYFDRFPEVNLADAAFTLQTGRDSFTHRRMLVCKDSREAAEILGDPRSKRLKSYTARKENKTTVFMFSGQGTQYVDMGLELYKSETVFKETVDECFKKLEPHVNENLAETVLYPKKQSQKEAAASRIGKTSITQPVLFVFEYALARLLVEWGIRPDAMIGYSYGEYVAACLAGVFPLDDVLKLVALRGRLMEDLPTGAMLSVPMREKELIPLLIPGVSLAVDNGPSCIVSGSKEDVDAFGKLMKERKLMCMPVGVSHAGHSSLMDPIMDRFAALVREVPLSKPNIPFISNVTGAEISEKDAVDPAYWANHMRSTVRFARGLEGLLENPHAMFLEVGPGKGLCNFARQHGARKREQLIINLVRDQAEPGHDVSYLLDRLGRMWLYGRQLPAGLFSADEKRQKVPMPQYSFEPIPYPVNVDAFKIIAQMLAASSQSSQGGVAQQYQQGPQDQPVQPGPRAAQGEGFEPAISAYAMERPQLVSPYVEPSGSTEELLAEIWANFFGFDKLGVEDDFFELGGDSLKAMTLSAQVHRHFNVQVKMADFFAHSTVRALAELIDSSDKDTFSGIAKADEKDYYPMSPAQRRLFILQQMEEKSIVYNEPRIFPMEMEVEKDHLEATFFKMIQRHESLRTSFHMVEEEPMQKIHPAEAVGFGIEYVDITAGTASPTGSGAADPLSVIHRFVRPFDLSKAPLIRVALIKQGETDYLLVVDTHHTIFDGVSSLVFYEEFLALYSGAQLPPLSLQYKDYAQWLTGDDVKGMLAEQETYWVNRFAGIIPTLEIPTDYSRPPVQDFSGSILDSVVDPGLTASLNRFAKQEEATLFMVSMAAFYILLSKLSGQEDIVIGTVVAGRRHADLERIIGMLVNTLPLREFPSGDKSLRQFIAEVKTGSLDAFANQEYPFEDLVENVAPAKDAGRNPLFDVLFTLQNPTSAASTESSQEEAPEPQAAQGADAGTGYQQGIAKFDLSFTVANRGSHLGLKMEYATRLFKVETLARYLEYYKNILAVMVEQPQRLISQVDIMDEAERRLLLIDFNRDDEIYESQKSLDILFAEQVERTPGEIALKGNSLFDLANGKESISLTYRQLDILSSRLAQRLTGEGAGPDRTVGLLVERSVEEIIGILGIIKTGAAYVPLNPAAPVSRNTYMLEETRSCMLLTTPQLAESMPPETRRFFLEAPEIPSQEELGHASHETPGSLLQQQRGDDAAQRLAYVIFTSGSTGKPKGVAITHGNLSPLLHWGYRHLNLQPGDRTLHNLAYYFDWSVMEIFITITSGAALHVVPNEILLNPTSCLTTIAEEQITVLHITPTQFGYLAGSEPRPTSLRYLFLGAEKLTADLLKRSIQSVDDSCRVFNMYGPTETTIATTFRPISREEVADGVFDSLSSVPIGKALANLELFVLDRYMNPCPQNVTGELYIGGPGVARGYLNNPELTSEKFVSSPFTHHPSPVTLYKTGDLARWLPDGTIEFMGRVDFQVKIRGLRIELGEIENSLNRHKDIKEAVVIAREDEEAGKGENYLCAYIVPEMHGETDIDGLRDFLAEDLPEYMIPAVYLYLEQFPLNPNGKIDRNALPTPDKSGAGQISLPVTPLEEKLAQIWAGVLNLEPAHISVKGNFFHMGGHSLKATVLMARIHKSLDVKLPLAELFKHPTIRQLAHRIAGTAVEKYAAILPVEKRDYYPLSSAQKRLYILQQMNPENTGYNMPMTAPIDMEIDVEGLEEIFNRLIQRHESLRTRFIEMDEVPVQVIRESSDVILRIDYWEIPADTTGNNQNHGFAPGSAEQVEKQIGEFMRPFDLTAAPLLRVGLIRLAEARYIFLMDMHHIITDGLSQDIFLREFMALLQGMELPPLKLQYKDYALWQEGEKEKDTLTKQAQYWGTVFEEQPTALQLPTDYPRPPLQGFEGDSLSFSIPPEETARLKQLAREEDATLYMTVLAVFSVLLSKLSGSEDIVIGTPIAGRRHEDLHHIIGMFVNTLALRNYPGLGKIFREFLRDVKESTLEAFENQEYPFEELVEQVTVTRDMSRNPLFDVMFSWPGIGEGIEEEPTAGADAAAGPDSASEEESQKSTNDGYENRTAKFDMTLTAVQRGGALHFSWQYCTRLFKGETIKRFIDYFKTLVSAVADNAGTRLGDIDIIPAQERQLLLETFSRTEAVSPPAHTPAQLIARQAARMPDQIAVTGDTLVAAPGHEPGSKVVMTYGQLDQKSTSLAFHLKERGVAPGSIIPILAERSIEMITAIVAVLKAGAAYLPLSPTYPAGRIRFLLRDSSSRLLLSHSHLLDQNRELLDELIGENTLYLDEPSLYTGGHNESLGTELETGTTRMEGNSAYVIYTSGTTGLPKGVIIENISVVNLVYALKERDYHFPNPVNIALISPFIFDASIKHIFFALMEGHTLAVASEAERLDGEKLIHFYRRQAIYVSDGTPAHIRILLNYASDLRRNFPVDVFAVGGEELDITLCRSFLQAVNKKSFKIVNVYGPTECCDLSTTFTVTPQTTAGFSRLPIGKPLGNMSLYIVDSFGRLRPHGVAGELCIGGMGLARGYLNRPELTAEKFVPNPFADNDSSNILHTPLYYKTGDLARWLPDGNVEFLGRIDHQVKIRGYRIEPGEIENCLLKHEAIAQAIVLDRFYKSGGESEAGGEDKYLCAYILPTASPEGETTMDAPALKEYLGDFVPEYMVPAYFVFLDRIPLTPNGKLDRKALPEPDDTDGSAAYEAPRTHLEKTMAEIWAGVLAREAGTISIDDSFFHLGGHSLKATILAARIHKALDVKIPLSELFSNPTIRGLSRYIQGAGEDKYAAVEPVEKREYYPLSSAQKRLYILGQLDEGESTAYNMPRMVPLEIGVEPQRLEETFRAMIRRHESLRTSFIVVNEEPAQRVHEAREITFTVNVHPVGPNYKTMAAIYENFIKPFDLSRAPLIRVALVTDEANHFTLLMDTHHIISDGTSHQVFVKEFIDLYSGIQLEPPKLQYRDYAMWQNSDALQEALKRQEKWWTDRFADQVPTLQLPTDFPRPAMQGTEGNHVAFFSTPQQRARLKGLADAVGGTLYIVMLALFDVWLWKLSGLEDIVVGTPIAGRRHADLQDIIGMFVNTLAMRNQPQGAKTMEMFLKEVKEGTLEAFENQEFPFEDLVDKVAVRRDTSRNPVFDVMFNLLNQAEAESNSAVETTAKTTPTDEAADTESPLYNHIKGTSKFDLNLTAIDSGDRLVFDLEYSTNLYTPATIERLIGYLRRLLEMATAMETAEQFLQLRLFDMDIISKAQRQALLQLSYGEEDVFTDGETIHGMFEDRVAKAPGAVALKGWWQGAPLCKSSEGETTILTYAQLDETANRLARTLRQKGVRRDTVVGVMAERSFEMIIALLAVLKAGGAYLPIDPGYPPERKEYMMEESGLNLLLINDDSAVSPKPLRGRLRGGHQGEALTPPAWRAPGPPVALRAVSEERPDGIEVLDLREAGNYDDDGCILEPLHDESRGDALLYVIYTSGSTGKPKGVMLEHRNLVNLMKYQYRFTSIDFKEVLQFTTISFDVSFQEIFSTLIAGGCLHLIDNETRSSVPALLEMVAEKEIGTLFLPASYLKFIVGEERYIDLFPSCVRHIVTAGEQLVLSERFSDLLRDKKVTLHNHYGPSEAHVVTALTMEPDGQMPQLPPIGKPVSNTAIYILDKDGGLQVPGVPGELVIGGIQVGRGYLNNPLLTMEKFRIENPGDRSDRVYFSGDLARRLPDGNIQFLGRIDHQVKIRGFRVEPGEIENRLLDHPDITDAAVLAREEESGGLTYLCAYIVAEPNIGGVPALRQYLGDRLPDFMIPSYFVFLDKMPLTPSGKIDRRALPEPEITAAEDIILPTNRTEKALAEIWADVLHIDESAIGIDANFFELGGHSLKATILTGKIHKGFHVKIPLAEVFKSPNIRQMAAFIDSAAFDRHKAVEKAEEQEYYPLSPAQKGMFILQLDNENFTVYNMPQFIPFPFHIDKERLESVFRLMIQRHETLRTAFQMVDDVPAQQVLDAETVSFSIQDLGETDVNTAGQLFQTFIRPFNLSRPPLFRVGLANIAGSGCLLMVDRHHIISDGLSNDLFKDEAVALYSGETPPPLALQYKDYAVWQNNRADTGNLAQQKEYWLNRFSDPIPVLNMPLDSPRPEIKQFDGGQLSFTLEKSLSKQLKELAAKTETTLFMLLLAAYKILLSKYANQEDIIVGTPVSGRSHADLEFILGMFVNMLPIRTRPESGKSLPRFLSEVKMGVLDSLENQDYHFEQLVIDLGIKGNPGRNPLFDVAFSLQTRDETPEHQELPEPKEENGKGEINIHRHTELTTSKFDLMMAVIEAGEKITIGLAFTTAIFNFDTIENLSRHYHEILRQMADNPEMKLNEIKISYQLMTLETINLEEDDGDFGF